MSDTPETDKNTWSDSSEGVLYNVVTADFARKLERERDETQYKLEDARQSLGFAIEEVERLKSERDQLIERNSKLRDIADRALMLNQSQ